MPVFVWEYKIQAWIRQASQRLLRPLVVLNVLLADEGVIFLLLPVLAVVQPALAVVVGVSLLITSTKVEDHIKSWFKRGRPRDSSEWGFPSGDCAIVSVWSPIVFGWWSLIPILIVAWARLARDAHFPLDVVGGTALGLWIGSLWWFL